jgi:uncharacterized protein (DUF305 family)
MRARIAFASLLAAAVVALTGCAGKDGGSTGTDTGTTFNDADVAFAQGMIPHHQQAIDMAKLADGRASSPVEQLAEDIEAAQGPEIQTMTNWLDAWGEDVPSGGMEGMDHGGMSGQDMAGMMTQDEMDELEAASGTKFDRMFLTMMIEHHEGAIDMARTEQANGSNQDAIALAEQIEADQKAEIQTMQDMLES